MATDLVDPTALVVPIASEVDLVQARQALRAEAIRAGLSLVEQTKLVTAGSELGRNILNYATGSRGELRVEQVRSSERRGVRATFSDAGPGIADIELAMTDGYSTHGSLGLGLPGSKRLVDEMTLTSSAELGTVIIVVKWKR